MRYVRSSVLDVIRLDYVTTARSKGLAERRGDQQARGAQCADPGGHAGGAADAAVFGGAIVTEQIFRIPASAAC
jgi:peptide/nickel transport system permease protein